MSTSFNFSSNITHIVEPLRVVVPYDVPTDDQKKNLEEYLNKPFELVSFTKKTEEFAVPNNFFTLSFDQTGERPVAVVDFSDEGWDNMAYIFLTNMAKQVKKDPKSVPRSLRMFAGLMDKLTEKPVGRAVIDTPRKIVIDRAIEQFGPTVRDVFTSRLQSWKK